MELGILSLCGEGKRGQTLIAKGEGVSGDTARAALGSRGGCPPLWLVIVNPQSGLVERLLFYRRKRGWRCSGTGSTLTATSPGDTFQSWGLSGVGGDKKKRKTKQNQKTSAFGVLW